MRQLRLGINIDHVATLRNARGGALPDPVRAAHLVAAAGADQITAHLREDRRHIRDEDIARLMAESALPLNMEMAATSEMLDIALMHKPFACCIVPERREELTTEGGLDAVGGGEALARLVRRLREAGIRVSLFIDAETDQVEAAVALGAHAVELHAGAYSNAEGPALRAELARIEAAAALGAARGLEVHVGHGLDYDNVGAIAAIDEVVELNIGHFLVGEALFVGLEASVRRMRAVMDTARRGDGAAA